MNVEEGRSPEILEDSKGSVISDEIERMKFSYNVVTHWLSLEKEDFFEEYKRYPVYPLDSVGAEKTLRMISSKWKFILISLLNKYSSLRYGEIKKALDEYGITNFMLTSSLKEMEDDKLVERKVYPEVPPHTEYIATQKSKDLLMIFIRMTQWYTKYRIQELQDTDKEESI